MHTRRSVAATNPVPSLAECGGSQRTLGINCLYFLMMIMLFACRIRGETHSVRKSTVPKNISIRCWSGPTIVFAGQVRSGRQENQAPPGALSDRVFNDSAQVTEYIAEHLGYKEAISSVMRTFSCTPGTLGPLGPPEWVASAFGSQVPICLDPTWFRQPGPLVADAKYRPPECSMPEGPT